MHPLRVAFFADSFHEVNGVAQTCRSLAAVAARLQAPLFLVYAGPRTAFSRSGSVTCCELRRGAASFAVDVGFEYDPLLCRFRKEVKRRLLAFAPDVVHITGPGDAGTLGLVLAKTLNLPLCASWHTNLHEYAGRRIERLTRFLPSTWSRAVGRAVEAVSLQALGAFYRQAQTVMAPNRELLDLLDDAGAGPGFPMRRGVDTALFTPNRRMRTDSTLTVGYVGRLTVEKNIRFLPRIEAALLGAGIANLRFVVVGEGSDREWLRDNLKRAVIPGILRGEALAEAYANMDIFVFPSRTDTFGNVVLEALASGVPTVVTDGGGPKFIVRDKHSGLVAGSDDDFLRGVVALARDPARRGQMSVAARRQAEGSSWETVWAEMYTAWEAAHAAHAAKR